jgi:hypothetical protein
MEVSDQLHAAVALCKKEESPCTYWTGDWVGPEPVWTWQQREKFPSLPLPETELWSTTVWVCSVVKLDLAVGSPSICPSVSISDKINTVFKKPIVDIQFNLI